MSAETKQPAAPQGDLAAWQERVSVSLESALYLCGNRNKLDGNEELSTLVFYIEQRVTDANTHLAAMPQAQPDAELLKALKDLLNTSPYQPASHRATVRAREVVARAEEVELAK